MYFLNILVLPVLIITIKWSFAQDEEQACMDFSQAPTQVQGQNKLKHSNQPLFRLHFAEHVLKEGQIIEEEYKVQVSSGNPLKGIKKVKIITETNGTCGIGHFKYDHGHFVQNKDPSCPGVLETKNQETLSKLPPLTWSPPSCGCVNFRVIVVDDDDVYYVDEETVQNGHLSQMVCVEMRRTRNHYLEALCSVSNRSTTSSIINSQSFISRHNLNPKTMDKYNLMIDLEFRRTHNRDCCRKPKLEDRVECLNDNRRRRLDNFCAYGFTDIPFAHFRSQHMLDKEKKCCRYLGEHRFICFGMKTEITHAPNATFLDFSMDDSDPANDLAIFATSKDEAVLNLLKFVKFQPKSITNDNNDDQLLGTSKEKMTGALQPTSRSKAHGGRSGENQLSSARNPGTSSKEMDKKHINRGSGEKRQRALEGDDDTEGFSVVNGRGKNGGTSGEKITKLNQKSGERKGENPGSKESKRQGRTSMERNSGSLLNVKDDVLKDELDGGSSKSSTLIDIRVKLDRLKLRNQCCGEGELYGSSVISRTTVKAYEECEHGAKKYDVSLKLKQGKRLCHANYAACCMEASIAPKMSSSEFKRSPYMAYNNEEKEPEVDNVQPDLIDEDELETNPLAHHVNGQPLSRNDGEEKAPNPDEADEEDEDDEMNGPQKFDAIDNEDDSADVLQRLELQKETELSRWKNNKEDDGMLVEDVTGLGDEALFKESISPDKAKKKPKVKDVFKVERQPQQKARKNAGNKQKNAAKAGPSSRSRKTSKERTSREKTSKERVPSRVRRTSAENVRVDDQSEFHVAKQDMTRETKPLRAKSTKKAMDSKEMSMMFYGQDSKGEDEKQGKQIRKSRWPNKG